MDTYFEMRPSALRCSSLHDVWKEEDSVFEMRLSLLRRSSSLHDV
jgi:hypothetical protein